MARDSATRPTSEEAGGREWSSAEREAFAQALISRLHASRRPFDARQGVLFIAAGLLAVAIVPVLVFFHYVWQSGFPIALFPLALCAIALVGMLVFAFNSTY